MQEAMKLQLALIQVHNCMNLLKGNAYENYMVGKLTGIKYELERQIRLTNVSDSIKLQETKAN